MESSKSKYKLDIFEVLKKISNSDIKYWNTLKEEQQKAFAPLVILRWLTSNTKEEIELLNYCVNPYVFSLGKHPQLLYNLMTVCTHQDSRYSWIKRETKNITTPKVIKLISDYLDYSIRETKDVIHMYSNDDILEISNEMGLPKEELVIIKRELKKRDV